MNIRPIVQEAIDGGYRVTMVTPKGFKPPKGFPRGELLCINADGDSVKQYDPVKVMRWLDTANSDQEAG